MYSLEPLKITKELILNKHSEEELMERYLGVPVRKGLIKSPLREDTSPTCAFYRNSKGDLIFKDFRGDFHGNFIGVVMYKYKCSWNKALRIIANDLNLIKSYSLEKNEPLLNYTGSKLSQTEPVLIQIEKQEYSEFELKFWNKYGITLETLNKFNVMSCKNVFLNSKLFHSWFKNQLVFGYYGGKKQGIEQWRIYFPNKKKYKFISNWRSIQIQGIKNIPETGDYLVVTKSLKDVMVLHELGIPAIAPISENLFISQSVFDKLKSRFKNIILFYDNDLAGIMNMNKIRKEFKDLKVIFIPRKYKVKDISDYFEKYGNEKTIELINGFKDRIDGKTS